MTDESEDLIKFLSPIASDQAGSVGSSNKSRAAANLATATPIKPNLSSNLIDFASPQNHDPFNDTTATTSNTTNANNNTELFSQTYTNDCFSPALNTGDNKTIVVNANNNNNSSNDSNNISNENDATNLDIIDIIETSDLLNLTTELEENW
jgi:hypothetical protein